MDDARDVAALLEERPDLEDPLRAVLEVDAEHDSWTFDDVPIDSGAFGELVSRELVEKTNDGDYRAAAPEALRAALSVDNEESGTETNDGETTDDSETTASTSLPSMDGLSGALSVPSVDETAVSFPSVDGFSVDVDRRVAGAAAGALALVVIFRVLSLPAVHRGEDIVLSGNDPYFYRYWVEQALAASGGVVDFSSLGTLSNAVQTGEPLLVATLWLFSSLFGGDATAAGWVLAWYPVVAAVVTAGVLYLLTLRVTADRRIALAAVLLLAITPGHAMRTSLGFADHHAFDYVWLMMTAYALVKLDRSQWPSRGFGWASAETGDERAGDEPAWHRSGPWIVAGGLGLALTGQVLAWDASPLFLAPLGLYVAVRVLDDVRADQSPLDAHLPLVGGIALSALLVYLVHTYVGWHSNTVAYMPTLLLVGVVGLLAVGELAHRLDRSALELAVVEAVGAVVSIVAFRTLFPTYWADALAGISRLTAQRNIAEVQPLLSGDAFGWLLLFGFVLVLAIPYLALTSRRAYGGEREWLVPVVYCWYFLALAALQVRFAGQLAMFAAVLAGLGFVHLASVVDLAKRPRPFEEEWDVSVPLSLPHWKTVGYLVVLFLLVGSLSFIQTPVKISQVTTDNDTYQTAIWINTYSEEYNLTYPDNYVLSRWGKNRVYNYFVSGESRSFSFARQTYRSMMKSTNPNEWYRRVKDHVGFIVTTDADFGHQAIHTRLHDRRGSAGDGVPGVEHFRLRYVSPGRTQSVFEPVAGAVLVAHGPVDTTTTIQTTMQISGETIEYTRHPQTTLNGWYAIRVPYAGNYQTENGTVTVSSDTVRSGEFTGQREDRAYWSLNAGRGEVAFDVAGGNHGRIKNADWIRSPTGHALAFNRSSQVVVPNTSAFDTTNGISVSVRFRTDPDTDFRNDVTAPRLVAATQASPWRDAEGFQIGLQRGSLLATLGNQNETTILLGPRVDDGDWHTATVTWNESMGVLFLDGRIVSTAQHNKPTVLGEQLTISGSPSGTPHFFRGRIDEVRIYANATQPGDRDK